MVRVVIAIANRCTGCLSTDYDDCEKRGNIRAVGFWHRHDEPNLKEELEKESKRILHAYEQSPEYSGALVTTEWKEYR